MPMLRFILNGEPTEVFYETGMHFLDVLREQCGIVSAKNGCAPEGTCGCCAVLIDGRPALACLRRPEQMEGRDVVSMEGLPEAMRSVLGESILREGGMQCGFCIPGILVRASSLLRQGSTGDREAVAKALSGHLCRCTGSARILDAIQSGGEVWSGKTAAIDGAPRLCGVTTSSASSLAFAAIRSLPGTAMTRASEPRPYATAASNRLSAISRSSMT